MITNKTTLSKVILPISVSWLLCLITIYSNAQKQTPNLIYIDDNGIIRDSKSKSHRSFFGVNYTVPFAYGYRSVKRTGIEIEKAIDQDVYHFARLGLNAFRVHVWDWEITDSLGNLLQNDHLRLFDYLIMRLKERNIKILITPIAFWGNGYPEKDIPTGSFSNVYGKGSSVVNENAIKAQENYLHQFFKHVNTYTGLMYKEDPDVIATEINNEPHHSGPKEKTTEYVDRLANVIKATGWTKPIFYNISESPAYADAVVKANVDGHSFQWYPTGLVANRSLKGNHLPTVDKYFIPFADTIPAFKNRAKIIYEFDAGDVFESYMYPAMARSFKSAGFQWATQFAYDPMATAYANTEYQTHYVNLAYTPSKAISLMIASKAFHNLPLYKSYGTYPVDTLFDNFRVSYANNLSEMNSPEEFYYSNSTSTIPVKSVSLKHIAGVGSSQVVKYRGTGAYFLDKISDGVWRLEVMPDAIHIRDPFEKASTKKTVTSIEWRKYTISLFLPDLGNEFNVTAFTRNDLQEITTTDGSIIVSPGTYLLKKKNTRFEVDSNVRVGSLSLHEFVAPPNSEKDVFVKHQPLYNVSESQPYVINALITGIDSATKILVEISNTANKWKIIEMKPTTAYNYVAEVPGDIVVPGLLTYRIIVKRSDTSFSVFPGNHKGDPYAWDAIQGETWQTYVVPSSSPVSLFEANNDRKDIIIYNPDWRNNIYSFITIDEPTGMALKMMSKNPAKNPMMGFQLFIGDKIISRGNRLDSLSALQIKLTKIDSIPGRLKVFLIDRNEFAWSAIVQANSSSSTIEIPLTSFSEDSSILLPRPYPGFQPLWFKPAGSKVFDTGNLEKLQVLFMPSDLVNEPSVEIKSVYLK